MRGDSEMCHEFDKNCEELAETKQKIIVVKDKKSNAKTEYRVENKSENSFTLLKVENCILKEESQCDYLLINCDIKIAYFIELKGADFEKAMNQILDSINKTQNSLKGFKSINARIVLTKTPSPNYTSNTKRRLDARLKTMNGNLKSSSNNKCLEEIP